MQSRERDLVFAVADGRQEIFPIIFQMRVTCERAKETDYLKMLEWLKENGIRGSQFLGWLKERNEGSVLQAIAEIRKRMLRDTMTRALIGH